MSGPVNSVVGPLVRALPRILGGILGLALIGSGDSDLGVVGLVGVGIFVLSVMTNPRVWWRYVRTGVPAASTVPAQFTEPGPCSVELRNPGARRIEVIKGLREVTAAGFVDAKDAVESVPVIVARGLSAGSASRVRVRLESAGATVAVVTNDD